MDLRQLRVFVAVAEEGSFTRAADRLFLTQQAVSSAVARLERELGSALLTRDHRGAEPTEAGTALLAGARDLLDRADRLSARVAALPAQRAAGGLRIGIFANGASQLNHPILEAFRRRHPEVDVHVRILGFADQVDAVLGGRVDVAIVRPPLGADERLEVDVVLTEPQVAMLPPQHALADAGELRAEQLLDAVFVDAVGPDAWTDHWKLAAHRNGEPSRTARVDPVADMPAANEVVALGLGVSTTAASCRVVYPHPGVRYVPIVDAPGSAIAVARRRDAPPPAAAFAATAAEVARELSDLLPGSTPP